MLHHAGRITALGCTAVARIAARGARLRGAERRNLFFAARACQASSKFCISQPPSFHVCVS